MGTCFSIKHRVGGTGTGQPTAGNSTLISICVILLILNRPNPNALTSINPTLISICVILL